MPKSNDPLKTNRPIRILQHGLGPIGVSIAKLVVSRPSLELVGGIDSDVSKQGKDLGSVLGLDQNLNIKVISDLEELSGVDNVDLVINSTTSSIIDVCEQIEPFINAGLDVISSCEELAFLKPQTSDIANRLNTLAIENNVRVLGTGINPGFMMDTFPVFLTSVCQDVRKVEVLRIVDATERRRPLQEKIGAGQTPSQFEHLKAEGKVRHVGLMESVQGIALAMGWEVHEYVETIEPIIAESNASTDFLQIARGDVAGIRQTAQGINEGQVLINLELQMYVGAPETVDIIRIDGKPRLENRLSGVHGDLSTAAVIVNSIPYVLKSSAGMVTMLDLCLSHFYVNALEENESL